MKIKSSPFIPAGRRVLSFTRLIKLLFMLKNLIELHNTGIFVRYLLSFNNISAVIKLKCIWIQFFDNFSMFNWQ